MPEVPGSLDPRLGLRLRALRQARGLSLRDLAARVPCSASFLSTLERGGTDVSATMLGKIARAVGLDAADLLPSSRGGQLVRLLRASQAAVSPLAEGVTARLLDPDLSARIQPVLLTIAPGASQSNPVGHAGEDFLYLLEGQVELAVEGQLEIALAPGDAAVYPAALAHRVSNLGAAPALLLTISSPPRRV